MTTFKEIRGTAIQSVSTDPSNPEVGQIWYNNSIGVLKGYQSLGGVWSSGGNLATARRAMTGTGTQTAGLAMGGFPAATALLVEEYDGTSWTGGGDLPAVRWSAAAAGTENYYSPLQTDPVVDSDAMASFRSLCRTPGALASALITEIAADHPTVPTHAAPLSLARSEGPMVSDAASNRIRIQYTGSELPSGNVLVRRVVEFIPPVARWCP